MRIYTTVTASDPCQMVRPRRTEHMGHRSSFYFYFFIFHLGADSSGSLPRKLWVEKARSKGPGV